MTWTPGPWEVHDGGHPFPQICGVWEDGYSCRPVAEMNGEEEHAKANARLIACAPEMAELLEEIVEYHTTGFGGQTMEPLPGNYQKIVGLLARARGET